MRARLVMHRSIYAVFFSALAIAGFVGGGCAQTGHTSPFDGDDGGGGGGGSTNPDGNISLTPDTGSPNFDTGGPMGTCMTGLKSIAISPANTTVTVTYSATLPTTKQAFTAKGTYAN